jgi:DNA-binding response OmpR family regulator
MTVHTSHKSLVFTVKLDINCNVTTDGKGVLSSIHENSYDLVLPDVALPDYRSVSVC